MKNTHTYLFNKVSSSYERYEERARIILQQVVAQVRHLQFYTKEVNFCFVLMIGFESRYLELNIVSFPQKDVGGPIIMTQIENEFGNYGYGDHPRDKVTCFWTKYIILLSQAHLRFLKSVLREEVTDSHTNIKKTLFPRELNLCCSPLTPQL